ncbi:MAG: hypothetical protein ACR2KJ_05020 [Jatrophihabitans sp.]
MNSTMIAAAAAQHHNDLLAEAAEARQARLAKTPRRDRPAAAKRGRRLHSPLAGLRTWLGAGQL